MTRALRFVLIFCAAAPLIWAFTPVAKKKMSQPPSTHILPSISAAALSLRPEPALSLRPEPAPSTEVLIAAAADLKFAMDSLAAVFSRTHTDISVKVVYGSSGNFFEQINNGAPFDIFFSADADYPRRLKEQNKTLSDVKLYGTGQIVLWSKNLDPNHDKMNTLLNSSVKKIAIANPAHAPYGKRAEESLRSYQLYDKIKDKLVIGENIAQTAQYVQTGAADIGIIALSLALSPSMQQTGGKYWLIPAASHEPLRQGYVLLAHAKGNTGADQFTAFFNTPVAASILQHFGFDKP